MNGLPVEAARLWAEVAQLHEDDERAADFGQLISRFEDPLVHGPDADGQVWLSGRRSGLHSAVNLTAVRPEIEVEALAWRAARVLA